MARPLPKGLNDVDHLATPKGHQVPYCKVCGALATVGCMNCKSTYCTLEHCKNDKLHSFVCDHLKYVQELKKYVIMSEERERRKLMCRETQLHSANLTMAQSMQFMSQQEPEQALLYAAYSLKIRQDILGYNHEETIEVHLLVSSCYMALKKLDKAINTLGQVEHHLLSRKSTSELVLGEYAKTCGQLALVQDKVEEAIYHFSNEVYHISQCFSTDHHRTAVSLWRLGKSFLRIPQKQDVTDSMYKQSVKLWCQFLTERLRVGEAEEEQAGRAVVSIGTQKKKGLLDSRAQADGTEMLRDILETRESLRALATPIERLLAHYVYGMFQFAIEKYYGAYVLLTICVEDILPNLEVDIALKEAIVKLFKRARRRVPAEREVVHLTDKKRVLSGKATFGKTE